MNRAYEPMFGGIQTQDENNQLNRVSYNLTTYIFFPKFRTSVNHSWLQLQMQLKLKVSLSPRWMLRKKLNFELRAKIVSYFKIVFCNLRCLLIRDIVDCRDKTLVVC